MLDDNDDDDNVCVLCLSI